MRAIRFAAAREIKGRLFIDTSSIRWLAKDVRAYFDREYARMGGWNGWAKPHGWRVIKVTVEPSEATHG